MEAAPSQGAVRNVSPPVCAGGSSPSRVTPTSAARAGVAAALGSPPSTSPHPSLLPAASAGSQKSAGVRSPPCHTAL
eukprot:6198325-Pleurochrysis_carterae.AAC.1